MMKKPQIQNIANVLTSVIFVLGALVSVWFLLTNLQPVAPANYLVALLIIIGAVALLLVLLPGLRERAQYHCRRMGSSRHFALIITALVLVLGVAIRLYCYTRFSYETSLDADPDAFYLNAKALASGEGIIGDERTASFTYLITYMSLLSVPVGLIEDAWLATIILNTVLDICGAVFAMLLVKKMSTKSKSPLLAFGLWFLSPFGIIFSLISLPIVVVNTCLIAAMYVSVILTEKLLDRAVLKTLLVALLAGIVIGIGNCFRPIFPVLIIALVLFIVFAIIKSNQPKKLVSAVLAVAAIVVIVVTLNIFQRVQVQQVSELTGLEAPSSSGGFSFFVGANRESNGRFNSPDWSYRVEMVESSPSLQAASDRLQAEGYERYRSYGVWGTIDLFWDKLYEFSNKQNDMYNANATIIGYQDSRLATILNIYILFYCAALYCASALTMLQQAKRARSQKGESGTGVQILLFCTILLLGLFLSHAFVEAAHRYAQVMYPIFIILAVAVARKPVQAE